MGGPNPIHENSRLLIAAEPLAAANEPPWVGSAAEPPRRIKTCDRECERARPSFVGIRWWCFDKSSGESRPKAKNEDVAPQLHPASPSARYSSFSMRKDLKRPPKRCPHRR